MSHEILEKSQISKIKYQNNCIVPNFTKRMNAITCIYICIIYISTRYWYSFFVLQKFQNIHVEIAVQSLLLGKNWNDTKRFPAQETWFRRTVSCRMKNQEGTVLVLWFLYTCIAATWLGRCFDNIIFYIYILIPMDCRQKRTHLTPQI